MQRPARRMPERWGRSVERVGRPGAPRRDAAAAGDQHGRQHCRRAAEAGNGAGRHTGEPPGQRSETQRIEAERPADAVQPGEGPPLKLGQPPLRREPAGAERRQSREAGRGQLQWRRFSRGAGQQGQERPKPDRAAAGQGRSRSCARSSGRQYMCCPPLIESVDPVMKSASSPVRNATPREMSSAWPNRPIGMRAMILVSTSGGTARTISVST